MNLKKAFAAGAACAMLLAVLVVPAAAHGGRGHGRSTTSYAVCTVDDCTETGRHAHSGVTYCGYSHASGYCTGSACSGSGDCGTSRGHHSGRHCR